MRVSVKVFEVLFKSHLAYCKTGFFMNNQVHLINLALQTLINLMKAILIKKFKEDNFPLDYTVR